MTLTTMFIAALILALAIGLVTWAWFAIAQGKDKLRSFGEFEGMHLESGATHSGNLQRSEMANPWPSRKR